jgi:hypothetical protein
MRKIKHAELDELFAPSTPDQLVCRWVCRTAEASALQVLRKLFTISLVFLPILMPRWDRATRDPRRIRSRRRHRQRLSRLSSGHDQVRHAASTSKVCVRTVNLRSAQRSGHRHFLYFQA